MLVAWRQFLYIIRASGRSAHRPPGARPLGRSHHPLLQPLGENKDVGALPTQISPRAQAILSYGRFDISQSRTVMFKTNGPSISEDGWRVQFGEALADWRTPGKGIINHGAGLMVIARNLKRPFNPLTITGIPTSR
ncbi:unnamed protein product [Nezara viridula]|uniref:Uncharacterized protein n=1 Tax=Nezara viridula TaxID=85310 RepID=A0A9P0H6G8_NEZVI|nr:unnamed protein product [Nezara viridula]